MAYAVESRANSPANTLREALDQVERQVIKLDGLNIEPFLVGLDQIEQMFVTQAANQSDLRPEEGRWESLCNRLRSKPKPVVAATNQAGGLAQLRAKHPNATGFWWTLDAEVARQRSAEIRRVVTTLVPIIVIAALLLWGVNFFFPPDPLVVLQHEATSQIEQLVTEQKWQEALTVVEQALDKVPDDPELLIWASILEQQLNNPAAATAALERAQKLVADRPALFWVTVGNQRLLAADIAGAAQAGQAAQQIDPNEPQATLLLSSVAEANNDFPTAIELLQKTADLARDKSPELEVIAKVRMGNLLQRPNFSVAASVTSTVTSTITTTLPLTPTTAP